MKKIILILALISIVFIASCKPQTPNIPSNNNQPSNNYNVIDPYTLLTIEDIEKAGWENSGFISESLLNTKNLAKLVERSISSDCKAANWIVLKSNSSVTPNSGPAILDIWAVSCPNPSDPKIWNKIATQMRIVFLTGAVTDDYLKQKTLEGLPNAYQTYPATKDGKIPEHVVELWFQKKSVVFWVLATRANYEQYMIDDTELIKRSKNLVTSIYEKI